MQTRSVPLVGNTASRRNELEVGPFNSPLAQLSGPMMDRLKSALEQLALPICPNCFIETRWVRSTLVAPEPVAIEHHFTCLSCDQVAEATTKLPTGSKPSRKLTPPWAA
jgi:hypothetical protein